MNTMKKAVVLLCLGGLSLTGCERLQEKSLSAEAEACRAQIVAFRANVGLDDVKMLRERRVICEQTLSLTNAEERIMLFREFVKEFYKIDISKCTVREASYMLGNQNYYSNCEYLAYGLIRAGGSREEAWQSLMTGLEKYRQMCFAYGDENDMSDGFSREAFDRRKVARWGPKYWKCCLLFCRDHTIRTVIVWDSKDEILHYQRRLQDRFGQWLESSADGNVTNSKEVKR